MVEEEMKQKKKTHNTGSSVKKRRRPKGSSSSTHLISTTTSKHNNNPNSDLISALPDSLLLHILSLLDMDKLVIQTSLLSRRWRYLWKSIPCLCFGSPRQAYFMNRYLFHQEAFGSPRQFAGLELTNFIDRCLFHHEGSKVHKLHIIFNYNQDTHAPLVDSWLHFAVRCKVEDFKFDPLEGNILYYDELYKLPRSLYMCTTLTSLNLCGCNLNLPDSFQLGSLRMLSLHIIELYSDSIEHLSSSCPLLEEIYLTDCNRGRDLINIVITNDHVKRLEISHYDCCGSGTIKINAPTLLSLGIYDCYPNVKFHFEELGSLTSVGIIAAEGIALCYEDDDDDDDDDDDNLMEVRKCVEKLLYCFRHVEHLKLCGQRLQVLSLTKLQNSRILPISATCLELNASLDKWELPGISYLLECCSSLQKLKIVIKNDCDEVSCEFFCKHKHDFKQEDYLESFGNGVPSIMQNIKTIEIELGGESLHEEFIRFLLKNAKVLERMVINTPKGYYKYNFELLFKFSQRLNAFPKSSPNAKLFIT